RNGPPRGRENGPRRADAKTAPAARTRKRPPPRGRENGPRRADAKTAPAARTRDGGRLRTVYLVVRDLVPALDVLGLARSGTDVLGGRADQLALPLLLHDV